MCERNTSFIYDARFVSNHVLFNLQLTDTLGSERDICCANIVVSRMAGFAAIDNCRLQDMWHECRGLAWTAFIFFLENWGQPFLNEAWPAGVHVRYRAHLKYQSSLQPYEMMQNRWTDYRQNRFCVFRLWGWGLVSKILPVLVHVTLFWKHKALVITCSQRSQRLNLS